MDPLTVTSWLGEWSRAWCVPGLETRIHVETSRRLRTALGRCHPAAGTVRIHPHLLAEPLELLREVVCHEAAHVAVHVLHGRAVRPHGSEWARLMRVAGYEPRARMDPARLSRSFRASVRPRVLYEHRCPVCDASRLARRPFYRWRCRACRESGREGRLQIRPRPQAPFIHPTGRQSPE